MACDQADRDRLLVEVIALINTLTTTKIAYRTNSVVYEIKQRYTEESEIIIEHNNLDILKLKDSIF